MSTVSIAIATWNGARHLETQLKSLLSQTRLPDEIVLRDDQSTDDTVEIARRILADAPLRADIAVNGTRLGSTRNFEAALRACTGDIVFFCDQDDAWDPVKVERLASILDERDDIAWAFCDARIADQDLLEIAPSFWAREGFGASRQRRFLHGDPCQVLLARSMVMGASLAFRRREAFEVLPIGHDWVHDEWIVLALASRGIRGTILPEALQSYRTHSAQQIGVSTGTALSRTKRDERLALIAREVARLEIFIAAFPEHAGAARAKRAHLEARRRILLAPPVLRVLPAIRELARGGYRFSRSPFAVAKDVMGF